MKINISGKNVICNSVYAQSCASYVYIDISEYACGYLLINTYVDERVYIWEICDSRCRVRVPVHVYVFINLSIRLYT